MAAIVAFVCCQIVAVALATASIRETDLRTNSCTARLKEGEPLIFMPQHRRGLHWDWEFSPISTASRMNSLQEEGEAYQPLEFSSDSGRTWNNDLEGECALL